VVSELMAEEGGFLGVPDSVGQGGCRWCGDFRPIPVGNKVGLRGIRTAKGGRGHGRVLVIKAQFRVVHLASASQKWTFPLQINPATAASRQPIISMFFFVFSKGNRSVVLLRTNPTRFYFRVKVLPEISFFALLAKGSSGTARFSTCNSFSTRDRMREWMNDLVALMW
jgi:hypothetical protein